MLTNVGLEHTRWLGPTERHIAEEKLAVCPAARPWWRARLPVRRSPSRSDWSPSVRRRLVLLGRDFVSEDEGDNGGEPFTVRTPRGSYEEIALRPLGPFQRANFALALAAAEAFLGRARR